MGDRRRLRLLQHSSSGRRRLPVGGAVGFNGPACLPSECGDDVIHVGARREGEIAVLPESGEHSACDGSPVTFSKLRPLLLLVSLFPAFRRSVTAVAVGVRGGKAAKTALRLGLRVVRLDGGTGGRRRRRRLLGIEILCRGGETVVHRVGVGVHSSCISLTHEQLSLSPLSLTQTQTSCFMVK